MKMTTAKTLELVADATTEHEAATGATEHDTTREGIIAWCESIKGTVSKLETATRQNRPAGDVAARMADLEAALIKTGPTLAADVKRLGTLEERELRRRALEAAEIAKRAAEDLANLTSRRARSLMSQTEPALA